MLIGYIFKVEEDIEGLVTYYYNEELKSLSADVHLVYRKDPDKNAFDIKKLDSLYKNIPNSNSNLVEIDEFIVNSDEFMEEGLYIINILGELKECSTKDKLRKIDSIDSYNQVVKSLTGRDHHRLEKLGKRLANRSLALDELV